MAKTGDPNGAGAPIWPSVTEHEDALLEIGKQITANNGPPAARCEFWETVTLPWPHL